MMAIDFCVCLHDATERSGTASHKVLLLAASDILLRMDSCTLQIEM
jgi:hypothetical protein